MSKDDTPQRLLDAALRVIAGAGACRLTLDAVAAEAGISKGGLLYHYPDKEALLAALLDRHLSQQAAKREDAERVHGTSTEGRLHALISVTAERTDAGAALPLVGILALEPRLLARTREVNLAFLDQLRADRTRFPQALIILLATSGLNAGEVFGTLRLTPAEREAVIMELHRLVDRMPAATAP